MNSRILKKLSKRADPIVKQLTDMERFVVSRRKGIEGLETRQKVGEKYLERWKGKPNKHGYFEILDGTVGYGAMQGYYEPEWTDIDAYSLLQDLLADHFTEWDEFKYDYENYPKPTIDVTNTSVVFANACALLTRSNTAPKAG